MQSLRILVAILIALPSWISITPVAADTSEARAPGATGGYAGAKRPKKPKTRGAPGPVVGVGLPMLIIAGAGAFWLVRRRRNVELRAIDGRATNQAP